MVPKNRRPAHPGEILNKEFLEPMGISQTKLAKHLGWSHAKVNEIVNGKRGVSPEAALSLSDAFRTSAEFWLNLQRNYDLFRAMENHEKKLKIAG